MNEITEFETPCHYREGRMYCSHGHIYVMEPDNQMASLALFENAPLTCPVCKGMGYILTPVGKQLIDMVWRHLERPIVDLIQEIKPLDPN